MRRATQRTGFFVTVVVFGFAVSAGDDFRGPWLSGSAWAQEEPQSGKEGEAKDKAETEVKDPDEAYVRKNLDRFLSPTHIEWLDDGRVHMTFDFRKKDENHNEIFTLPVGNRMKDRLRWTIFEEEIVIGGDTGLRVSNSGSALLRAWFTGPVEAEIEFLQHINFMPRHMMAVVFLDEKAKGVGANFGSQCLLLSRGRVVKRTGEPEPVRFNAVAKIRLEVRKDKFVAVRNGVEREELPLPRGFRGTGRLGLLWGGAISGTVCSLDVKGKLDYKKTAEEIRKYRKGRGGRRRR